MKKRILSKSESKTLTRLDAFNFPKLMVHPLSLDIARIKNPSCSDDEAADQIATAIHEACHIVPAVLGGHVVDSAIIPTTKPLIKYGMEVAGWAGVYDDDAGWYAVMNRIAAATFDWILSRFEETPPVEWDYQAAIEVISELHHVHPKREGNIYLVEWLSMFRNYHGPLDNETKQFIFESALANTWAFFNGVHFWGLIRATAINLLTLRDKSTGTVYPWDFKLLFNWLRQFSPYDKNKELPFIDGVPTFQDDMKTLWRWHGVDGRKSTPLLKRFDKICSDQRQHEAQIEAELLEARAD